ncbi:SMI1/KNR4 family protein [Streptomyces bambusae]|uniref:SMI1/KNR4 family protein n=1 Tax=Streptomyces bambusae TaxID=1550616 RepID=A0ABS6Z9W2_9ACTN|nr:SMI1/KNR4 family protein [Streptomyces bambusae]MBW5483455.1 SMI1/KNR4 family protein [Streptomyces bambusae]
MNETEQEQLLERVAAHVRTSRQGAEGPLPAVASAVEVARVERIAASPLPPLLTGLYTRVANGGFGPEYGLLTLEQAIRTYEDMRASAWRWPEGVLPMADFGCGMLMCVDCRSDTAQVLLFDPNPGDPDLAWYVDAPGLADWLRGWLDGTAWFCEESGAGEEFDLELAPWPDLRSRT